MRDVCFCGDFSQLPFTLKPAETAAALRQKSDTSNFGSALLHVDQRPGGIVLLLPDRKGQSDCADGQRALSPGAARGFTVCFFVRRLLE